MKTTPVPPSKCPNCEAELNFASNAQGHTPGPKDLSVCRDCAALLVFQDDMQLRLAKPTDLQDLNREQYNHLVMTKMEVIAMIAMERMARHRNN